MGIARLFIGAVPVTNAQANNAVIPGDAATRSARLRYPWRMCRCSVYRYRGRSATLLALFMGTAAFVQHSQRRACVTLLACDMPYIIFG